MIKLTNILNELNINNPNITVEKVYNYFHNNFYNEFSVFHNLNYYYEYKELCEPYCEKYNIFYYLGGLVDFQKLSKQDLNQFYREMRVLIRKHNGTEILNELNVNKPIRIPIFKDVTQLKKWLEEESNLKYFINNLLPLKQTEKETLLNEKIFLDIISGKKSIFSDIYHYLSITNFNLTNSYEISFFPEYNYECEEIKLPRQTLYLLTNVDL